MLETIDIDTLDYVTGGAASSSYAMIAMAAILGKRKPGGFNINDDGKRRLFDLFKGQFDKKAKPAEPAKAAKAPEPAEPAKK